MPDLLEFNDLPLSWPEYEKKVYKIFLDELINYKAMYKGSPVYCHFHPPQDGFGATFCHITSYDEKEYGRVPDKNRCARIKWLKVLIENPDEFKCWVKFHNKQRPKERHYIWSDSDDFVVILGKRIVKGKERFELITAYCTDKPYTRDKFQKAYLEFLDTTKAA